VVYRENEGKVEEEAHEEVEAQKAKDEGKIEVDPSSPCHPLNFCEAEPCALLLSTPDPWRCPCLMQASTAARLVLPWLLHCTRLGQHLREPWLRCGGCSSDGLFDGNTLFMALKTHTHTHVPVKRLEGHVA